MLFFAAPLLLSFLPVVALLGFWALWRSKRGSHRVPSARLWRNLADTAAATARRRLIDPVWLLIFLAALLAAAALPKPAWRTGVDPSVLPAAQVQWSLRSLAGRPPELFVRLSQQRHLMAPLTLESHTSTTASKQTISPNDAAAGTLVHLPNAPAPSEISLRLLAGHHLLAAATFLLPQVAPFALLSRTAPGRTIDPALYRVFAVNPQARPDDPRIHPAVLLVNDPTFTLNGVPPDTLIVASPDTPLPGITLGTPYAPPAGIAPLTLALPVYITFNTVTVARARSASLSPDWTALARLDHQPWLAQRRIPPAGPTLLWLASQPSADANWALDRSFVVFFADALAQTFPAANTPGDSQILHWQRTDIPIPPPPAARVTQVAAPLGIAAILLLAIAIALLLARTRDFH